MIYTLIDQVQQKANIAQACRVLGVSRASYYATRQRAKAPAICVVSVQVKAALRRIKAAKAAVVLSMN